MKTLAIDLYTATACAHCADMKTLLTTYLDAGQIKTLDIINIEQQTLPDAFNFIRSVPVMVIADLPFVGNYNRDEIDRWLSYANENTIAEHFIEQNLIDGNLNFLISLLTQAPALLPNIILLLENDETGMQVRIGITALVESLAGSAALRDLIPAFKQLTTHENINTVTDALYYLSLTEDISLNKFFTRFLQHDNAELKSIAEDFLTEHAT